MEISSIPLKNPERVRGRRGGRRRRRTAGARDSGEGAEEGDIE